MSVKQLLVGLFVAGLIAASVRLFIAPKLETSDAGQSIHSIETPVPSVEMDQPAAAGETRRSTVLSLRNDGHYWARTLVNRKTSVEFMVDTGASVVALTYRDAERMGLKPAELDYRWRISTAGGETMGASVLIDSIKINQVHIRDVEAMVLRTDLEQSLLGMSFLSKLYSYEFRGDRLIIRQ